MTIIFPEPGQLEAVFKALPSFECPSPDKTAFGAKFDGSVSLAGALNFADSQLCSGLYLAGLILSQSNASQDYICDASDLSDFEIEGTEVRLVIGNLTVAGDLEVSAPLIVTGDLVVEGRYWDQCAEARVAVLGNLMCHNMRTTAWVIVGGQTKVENFFYAHHNDDAFETIGMLSARAIMTDDHQILAGSIMAEFSPLEGSCFGESIFDTRQDVDIRHLLNLWDDNFATVIDLDDLQTRLENE
ncbi:hypothetical protein IFT48_00565 [Pseudomonas fluorescens]|uniref:hypothetical protein n=1 Tax=Pseudomonas TaxID=286 RepID=UPI000F02E340|nr:MULTISPECIES: hypothetical protein [Pseudomonas]MBD8088483.1 hypothetical protein [Pseudomonas fluorescens]MBD8615070.1 hypothetical protein [Pseudomonas putida]MBD8681254.1 hypothetical protein [Pseudomonas sp. CFBP 13719]